MSDLGNMDIRFRHVGPFDSQPQGVLLVDQETLSSFLPSTDLTGKKEERKNIHAVFTTGWRMFR